MPESVQGCWECLHDKADHIDSFGECMVGWDTSDPSPACQCIEFEEFQLPEPPYDAGLRASGGTEG